MSKVSLGLVLAGAALVISGAAVGCGEEERAPLLIKDAQGGSYSYGGAAPDPDDGINHFPGATGSGQCSGSESMAHMEGEGWEWDATTEDATFYSVRERGSNGARVSISLSGFAVGIDGFAFFEGTEEPLVEKTYSDAVYYPSSGDKPEMYVPGCSSNFSDASFSISEIEWNENGLLERFRASFDRHCDDGDGEDQSGCVLYVRGAQ